MLHIDIENIPAEVSKYSELAIEKCQELEADLNGGAVKAIELYLPATTTAIEGAKTLLGAGIAALQALKAIGDDEGLKGRLLTLSTSLASLQTESKHEWGVIITWVQTVFNHWKKKQA